MVYKHAEKHSNAGIDLRDFILGFQDGLVNVLGVVLAVAIGSGDFKIIMLAGIAAAFAESISMGAVAYTSTKSTKDFYLSELEREKWEIKNLPEEEKKEVRDIYYSKGFRGSLLNSIVKKITSNKKLWLETMMKEELGLIEDGYENPVKSAIIVGISAIAGSVVPLIAFLLMPVSSAVVGSVIFSILILFLVGVTKAKITRGNIIKNGLEIAVIGILSALAGYAIGAAIGVII